MSDAREDATAAPPAADGPADAPAATPAATSGHHGLVDRELAPCHLPDGRVLTGAEFGSPTGRPVVVLDGAGSRLQGRLANDLGRSHDIRVITPDRPGFYGSTPHAQATFTTVADDVRHLLDALGLSRVGLLAMSGGTGFGCTLAARHPDVVARFGLLGPIAPVGEVDGTRGMDMPSRMAFTLGARAPWLLERLLTTMRWQTRRDRVRAALPGTRDRARATSILTSRTTGRCCPA